MGPEFLRRGGGDNLGKYVICHFWKEESLFTLKDTKTVINPDELISFGSDRVNAGNKPSIKDFYEKSWEKGVIYGAHYVLLPIVPEEVRGNYNPSRDGKYPDVVTFFLKKSAC